MSIWNTLQIEPTTDIAAIKKAYAALIKQYNPEEHMQRFLTIRKAYQQALTLAAADQDAKQDATLDGQQDDDQDATLNSEQAAEQHVKLPSQQTAEQFYQNGEAPPIRRDFVYGEAANAYTGCEAMIQLRSLYFEKNCRNKKLWIGYFVSAPFLDVFCEAGFTAQLGQELTKQNITFNKVFFSLLPIVYGLASPNNKNAEDPGVGDYISFDGIEHIHALIEQYNVSVNLKDDLNQALLLGYKDYFTLRGLTRTGEWNDSIAHSVRQIIGQYTLYYICDNIPQRHRPRVRHISSLQLINHYFAAEHLPRQAYKIAWDKFDLKNAKMGRNKVLYGRLREICLEKCPEPDMEKPVSLALQNELNSQSRQTLRLLRIEAALKEDMDAPVPERPLSTGNRAFFRYLLNVSFPRDYGQSHGLRAALDSDFPYDGALAVQLLGYDCATDSYAAPRQLRVQLDNGRLDLEISFWLYYVGYRLNGKPVYAPILTFETVRQIRDDLIFWVLLPLTFAALKQCEAVYDEVFSRLKKLGFLEDASCSLISHSITGRICQSFEGEYMPNIFCIQRERFGVRYAALIDSQDWSVLVFKTTAGVNHRSILLEVTGSGLQNAIWLGEQRLEAAITPFDGTHLQIDSLPDQIHASAKQSPAVLYMNGEVTLERIIDLLRLYQELKLSRLELTWGERRLVLIEAEGKYACFGFDDNEICCLSYLAQPEIYYTVDSKDVQYESFLYGQLPSYLLHIAPEKILSNINYIIRYISDGSYLKNGRWQDWSEEVYHNCKHKYAFDKCLLGGFPIVTPDSPLYGKFVLPRIPVRMRMAAPDGTASRLEITPANQISVSEALIDYLMGRLTELTLLWVYPRSDGSDIQRRIELLSSNGSYAMLYSDSGNAHTEVLVADVKAYINDEGKKQKLLTLCGYKMADYMIHHDLHRIRGYLNVLLATIDDPGKILGIFGEFALLPAKRN